MVAGVVNQSSSSSGSGSSGSSSMQQVTSVPLNAQLTNKANANATYKMPSGENVYYNIPQALSAPQPSVAAHLGSSGFSGSGSANAITTARTPSEAINYSQTKGITSEQYQKYGKGLEDANVDSFSALQQASVVNKPEATGTTNTIPFETFGKGVSNVKFGTEQGNPYSYSLIYNGETITGALPPNLRNLPTGNPTRAQEQAISQAYGQYVATPALDTGFNIGGGSTSNALTGQYYVTGTQGDIRQTVSGNVLTGFTRQTAQENANYGGSQYQGRGYYSFDGGKTSTYISNPEYFDNVSRQLPSGSSFSYTLAPNAPASFPSAQDEYSALPAGTTRQTSPSLSGIGAPQLSQSQSVELPFGFGGSQYSATGGQYVPKQVTRSDLTPSTISSISIGAPTSYLTATNQIPFGSSNQSYGKSGYGTDLLTNLGGNLGIAINRQYSSLFSNPSVQKYGQVLNYIPSQIAGLSSTINQTKGTSIYPVLSTVQGIGETGSQFVIGATAGLPLTIATIPALATNPTGTIGTQIGNIAKTYATNPARGIGQVVGLGAGAYAGGEAGSYIGSKLAPLFKGTTGIPEQTIISEKNPESSLSRVKVEGKSLKDLGLPADQEAELKGVLAKNSNSKDIVIIKTPTKPSLLGRILGQQPSEKVQAIPVRGDLYDTGRAGLGVTGKQTVPVYNIKQPQNYFEWLKYSSQPTYLKLSPTLGILKSGSSTVDVEQTPLKNALPSGKSELAIRESIVTDKLKYQPVSGDIYALKDNPLKLFNQRDNLPVLKSEVSTIEKPSSTTIFDINPKEPKLSVIGKQTQFSKEGIPITFTKGNIFSSAGGEPITKFNIFQYTPEPYNLNYEGGSGYTNPRTSGLLALSGDIALQTTSPYALPSPKLALPAPNISPLESRLLTYFQAEGFPTTGKSTTGGGTGTKTGNGVETYVAIENKDGTISYQKQKQVQKSSENQEEKQITEEKQTEETQKQEQKQDEQTQKQEQVKSQKESTVTEEEQTSPQAFINRQTSNTPQLQIQLPIFKTPQIQKQPQVSKQKEIQAQRINIISPKVQAQRLNVPSIQSQVQTPTLLTPQITKTVTVNPPPPKKKRDDQPPIIPIPKDTDEFTKQPKSVRKSVLNPPEAYRPSISVISLPFLQEQAKENLSSNLLGLGLRPVLTQKEVKEFEATGRVRTARRKAYQ